MHASRMGVHQIGVGTFHPYGEVGGDEQVKNAIDAVGRNAFPARLRHRICDVIGRRGTRLLRECVENGGSHFRPLFAMLLQRGLCRVA